MALERLRQDIEAQERVAQEERLRVLEAKQLTDQQWREADQKARELSAEQHKKAGVFREQSGILNAMKRLQEVIGGSLIPSEEAYKGYHDARWGSAGTVFMDVIRRESDSQIDLLAWKLGDKTKDESQHTNFLFTETCPSGTIVIHGLKREAVPEIKPWLFGKGTAGVEGVHGSTVIPEATWRNNSAIFEEALVKAYTHALPITRIQQFAPTGE